MDFVLVACIIIIICLAAAIFSIVKILISRYKYYKRICIHEPINFIENVAVHIIIYKEIGTNSELKNGKVYGVSRQYMSSWKHILSIDALKVCKTYNNAVCRYIKDDNKIIAYYIFNPDTCTVLFDTVADWYSDNYHAHDISIYLQALFEINLGIRGHAINELLGYNC